MKLTVDTKTLATHAAWVRGVTPKKPAVPVLAGMHLTATDGTLTLTGTDYDTTAHATCDAAIDTPGEALVSAHVLADVLATLPADTTTRMHTDGTRLHLTCGTAKFALATMAVEDYPEQPPTPAPLGRLAAADLAAAVGQVDTFALNDDTLPALCAIQLRLSADGLTLSTTDRYRIAERTQAWTPTLGGGEDREILVHHRALAHAVRGLTGDVELGATTTDDGDAANIIGVSDGTRTLLARLLDGQFPKTQTFLDQTYPENTLVEVDVAALAAVVKRVSVVLEDKEPVLLNLDPGAGTIGVSGEDGMADAGSDIVDAQVEGPAQTVAFNARYLADVLASHDGQMRMRVPVGTKPVLTHSGENYRVMVMPIRRGNTSQAAA